MAASPAIVPQPIGTDTQGNPRLPSNVTEIPFFKAGTVPPVYVAASWTSPPWDPIEMTSKPKDAGVAKAEGTAAREFLFTKRFENIPEGTHQYKFRLGAGDWWTTAEDQKITTDKEGNKNNVLIIPGNKQKKAAEETPSASEAKNPETALQRPNVTLSDVAKTVATTAATSIGQIPAATMAFASNSPIKISESQTSGDNKPKSAAEALKDAVSSQSSSAPVSTPVTAPEQVPLPATPASEKKSWKAKNEVSEDAKQSKAGLSDTAERIAKAPADVADVAQTLERPQTSHAIEAKGAPLTETPSTKDSKQTNTDAQIKSLAHFQHRVDTLLADASGIRGLRDVDHITDQEPGHFPSDEKSDSSKPLLSSKSQLPSKTWNIQKMSQDHSVELFAGLFGGFFGGLVAWIMVWLLFGHK